MDANSPPQASPWNEDDRLAALVSFEILDTPVEAEFEDIVYLASEIFGAPIAMINLVAQGRQWFKAEVGIGARELPAGEPFCAHAILQQDIIVVPDTRLDERFLCNPLVTAGDGLRFYAGALLKTAEGLPIGTVCVLDRKPRPDGITGQQQQTLKILARLVMKQLELRRAIKLQQVNAIEMAAEVRDRELAESGRRDSEDRYRSLFNSLEAGFCIIQAAFDMDGKCQDYQFLEINPAFVGQTGMPDVVGKWMRELAPDHEQFWFDVYGEVAQTGAPARFENRASALGDRWYDVHAFRVGAAESRLVAVLFTDISDRKRADARRDALLAIGDRLRSVESVPAATRAASEIVANTIGAIRAGFGRLDPTGEYVTIEPDWSAQGFASIAGSHRLGDYGDLQVVRDKPVVIDDVRADRAHGLDQDALESLGVRAMANLPVRDYEGTISLFFAHADRARKWSTEDLTFLSNAGDRVAASVARFEAEALQQVLNLELSHRMKNTLAMVQAIAKQTLRPIVDQKPVETFKDRLQALSTAHMSLLQRNWNSADLKEVLQSVLQAFGGTDRFDFAGPAFSLGSRATLSMSLLLHELATNAFKYGALSSPAGRVSVSWELSEDSLLLKWREIGGPGATAPVKKGFGSRLIGMGLLGTGGVDLRYLPTGFEGDFSAPLAHIQLP